MTLGGGKYSLNCTGRINPDTYEEEGEYLALMWEMWYLCTGGVL